MLFIYLIGCGEKDIVDSGENSQIFENVDDSEDGTLGNEQSTEDTQENEVNDPIDREGSQSDNPEDDEEDSLEEDREESQIDNPEEDYEENDNTSESSNEQDTYTGNEICDIDDLNWNVRVIDDNESSSSPYSSTTSLSIIGEVTNNCDGELVLSTMTDCIVYSGTLYANSGLGTHIWTNTCQVFSTSWVFAPFETKGQTEIITSRPEDHYELTIFFADTLTTMVQYSFDVE